MGLVKEGLQIANNNTLLISSYLKQVANENGYTQETKDLFMLLVYMGSYKRFCCISIILLLYRFIFVNIWGINS